MSSVVNLTDKKRIKKLHNLVSDFKAITHVFSLTQRSLTFYKTYVNVQEIISILETNIQLMDIEIKKYSNELEKLKK